MSSHIARIKKGWLKTMLNLKVFIISVGIAFSIQIIHSILTKGWRFTLEFFGGGFLLGFVREFIYSSFIQTYDFPNMPAKILNVPVFIPIGWVFTFYLAYEFTDRLIKPKTVKDHNDFIIFAAIFSTCVCIPIETAAMNMNWWWLKYWPISDHIAPLGLMGGWFYTTVVFFCIYFVMKKKFPHKQLCFIFFLLLIVCVGEIKGVMYGSVRLALALIVLFGMFKYNKEMTLISLIFLVIIEFYFRTFFLIPNAIFVTITFMFLFIYVLVKLHYRSAKY